MPVSAGEHINNDKPLIWDIEELKQRYTNGGSPESKAILLEVGNICNQDPVIIVEKKSFAFIKDVHYYCSIGQYWWPDSLNPGQYINRDGFTNPESRLYDRKKLVELKNRCQKLSIAFYLTKDVKYYIAFIEQIKAWFINEETYMYPNFEYSQVIPGKNDNKGRGAGMVDMYDFNTVIESIRLVNGEKKIDRRTMKALQKWFAEFAKWAEEGPFGEYIQNKDNNIGLACDVTLINMFLFSGNERKAKQLADSFVEKRINAQVLEDGRQPAELVRTNAFSYSISNISHMIDFYYLVRFWDKCYYIKNGESLKKAFDYLQYFADNPNAFPYQQIASWESCIVSLKEQERRINKLVDSNTVSAKN